MSGGVVDVVVVVLVIWQIVRLGWLEVGQVAGDPKKFDQLQLLPSDP